MKRSTLLLTVLIAMGTTAALLSHGFAQAPAAPPATPTRVAVCDVAKVFNNYQRAKDLTAEFEQRRRRIKVEDDRRDARLKQLQATLSALKPGSKEHETRLAEYMKASIERQVWRKMQEELAIRQHRRLTEEMYKEILRAVDAVAKERGFDLVIYLENVPIASASTSELLNKIAQRKVLYHDPRIDITQTVLQRVNSRYRPGPR